MKLCSSDNHYTYAFILKIQNKGKIQQIASNHSSDTYFADFKRLYRTFTAEPC